eukprot:scaffold41791_cov36-Phaeocystis_antarctica.AAC.1
MELAQRAYLGRDLTPCANFICLDISSWFGSDHARPGIQVKAMGGARTHYTRNSLGVGVSTGVGVLGIQRRRQGRGGIGAAASVAAATEVATAAVTVAATAATAATAAAAAPAAVAASKAAATAA